MQSVDEFDFRSVGGRFILPVASQRESSLETFTFTWDLKKIMTGRATERSNALAAAKAYAEVEKELRAPVAPPFSLPLQAMRTPETNKAYYHRLRSVSGVGHLEWTLPSGTTAFPGIELAADGVLYGTPAACSGTACTHEFKVKVTDERQKTAECTIRVVQQ
jgi:hypothetical protein